MASGVGVSDSAVNAIAAIKIHLAKDDPRCRNKFLFFKIEKGEISVDKAVQVKEVDGEDQDAYQIFKTHLLAYPACYALWDCCYETKLTKKSELVFIMWVSDKASVKERMLYSSSKQSIKKALSACGIKHEWEMNDDQDIIDRSNLFEKLAQGVIKLEKRPL